MTLKAITRDELRAWQAGNPTMRRAYGVQIEDRSEIRGARKAIVERLTAEGLDPARFVFKVIRTWDAINRKSLMHLDAYERE